jgi:hypothetical protein
MAAIVQEGRPRPRISPWRAVTRLRRLFRRPIDVMVELAAGGEISPFVDNKTFVLNTPELAYEMLVQHAADVERSPLDRGNLVPLVGAGSASCWPLLSIISASPPMGRPWPL